MPRSDESIYDECHNEIILHRAVLDRALVDSFSQSRSVRATIDSWLYLENKDFLDACERALLNPKLVLMTFKIMKKVLTGEKARYREFGKNHKHKQDK